MKDKMFQVIDYNCQTLAYVIRCGDEWPDKTTFVTPEDCTQQVGFIVYEADQSIPRHFHNPIKRQIVGTSETLLILKGKCIIDFYDNNKSTIASHTLNKGDLIIIVGGGHGFRMLEDTKMLEVKQGPYPGKAEKELF